MEINHKSIINNINNSYVDTVNSLFFTPDFFVENHYIKNLNDNMENILINEILEVDDETLVKFIIGLCKDKMEDYFSAIEIFEDLLKDINSIKNVFIAGNIYSMLSILYLKLNNFEYSKKYFDLAINFLESNFQNESLLFLYINVSITKLKICKFDSSVYININNAFRLLSEAEYSYSSQAYLKLGVIYFKYLNLNNIAIKIFKKGLSIAKENKDDKLKILINFYIAKTYRSSDKTNDSLEILNFIIREFNEILPCPLKIKIYNEIIKIYINLNKNSEIIEEFLELYKKELYKIESFYFDVYLAKYNLLQVKFKISKDINPLTDLFYYLDNASYIYKSNLSKFRFMDFCYWLEISYGNVFFKLKDYKNALFHHKKSLLYSEKFQDRRTINSFKLISKDYEALSDFKESLIYFKKSNYIIERYDKIKNHDLFIRLFEDYENSKSYHSVKNNFFSNLSHELRTPVNIIYSYVQLMSSLKDKDSYHIEDCFFKYERSIKQNCLRMLKLINNLIDITKIDSGSVQLNTSPLDIVPFIENLTLSVIPYTKYKSLNIIFDTNIENLYMKLDPYALERILLNLLSNSIKFTRTNGNILVKLDKTNFDLKIIVRDDGIGIPDNLKDLVFNRFFKVDTTLSRNTEGSGIGLSITKGLVEMQGGYIYLNKDYTDGCEFVITFSNMLEVNDSIDVDFKHFIDDEKILRELSDIYELF